MKKFLIGLLTLALILTAAGCGVKEKLGKMEQERHLWKTFSKVPELMSTSVTTSWSLREMMARS